MRKEPILTFSWLSGRVYIATSYEQNRWGGLTAKTKYDVTEAFEDILVEVAENNRRA